MATSQRSAVAAALHRKPPGVPVVVSVVMAAAAPLTVVAGRATTGYAVTGVAGLPVAFLVVGAVLALFAVGYVAMSRRIGGTGVFYTYVTRGLGRPAGVAAAFVALLAYNAQQVALAGGFGAALSGYLDSRFGWPVPWWVCALAGWAVVGVLGLQRIGLNGRVLAVLLTLEIVIVVLYDAVLLTHAAGGHVSADTLSPAHLVTAGIGAALLTAISGFAGIEATVVFVPKTKHRRRTVAWPAYFAVAATAVLCGVSAWAMSVATGPDTIVPAARADRLGLLFTLVAPHVGRTLVDVGQLLFLTGLFAALLAFHNTVARYLFSLGRQRILPPVFGRISRRTGAPRAGSLAQSLVALAVIVGYAAAGLDPVVQLFFWLGVTGALGVLILMVATCAAVIAFFFDGAHPETLWRRMLAPAVAGVYLFAALVVAIAEFDTVLGVAPGSPLRWLFPATYVIAALLGPGWALRLRTRRTLP